MIKELELWRIDEWDGGERQLATNKYLTNEEAAKRYAEANRHDRVVPVVLVLVDAASELAAVEHKRVRAQALAKLTPLERHVLGLQ